MTEDVLAARERADAFALLDVHQHRRAIGIATVSSIVGATAGDARAVAYAWAAERALPIVRAGDVREGTRRWFSSAFLRPQMRARALGLLARTLGCGEGEALNRYRDRPKAVVDALRPADAAIAATTIALGVGDLAPAAAWERLLAADPSGRELPRIVRVVFDLFGRDGLPALLFSPDFTEAAAERRCVEIANLAESVPALCAIVATTTAIGPVLASRLHAGDLLAEGAIYLGQPRERFFDDPDVARAIAEAETARDDASRAPASDLAFDRARSAAERALKTMLDRHPTTTGRFVLNGLIDATFGNRNAEIDLLDARARIALEVDGYHHFRDADAYRRDRRKDAMLQAEGYLVLRTLADDVIDRPHEVLRTIVHAVQRRDLRGE